MKRKIRVAVLMGGKSSEHEISIISGTEVVKNLKSEKYDILPIVISKNGNHWKLTNESSLLNSGDLLKYRNTNKEIILTESEALPSIDSLSQKRIDIVFIALHGKNGEDGRIQGMLDLAGMRYTGSGVLASGLGMDKAVFRKVMQAEGIPVPKLSKTFPCFVKPSDQGSSVGASIATNAKELKKAIIQARKFSNDVLIEEYIKGIEVTCAVLGNKNPIALPVIEIVPKKGSFFNYESKYTESGAEEIVPARISIKLTKNVQKIAIKAYKAIGCSDFARVDFIIKDSKDPVVLEINTIPGLTPLSLLPKAAKAAGISYSLLLDKIVGYAMGRGSNI